MSSTQPRQKHPEHRSSIGWKTELWPQAQFQAHLLHGLLIGTFYRNHDILSTREGARNQILGRPEGKKSFICPEGKLMISPQGKTFLLRSSQRLSSVGLGLLQGFLDCHCALQGPSTCCFQNYRDAWKLLCVAIASKAQWSQNTYQELQTQTLIVRFLKIHLFSSDPLNFFPSLHLQNL